MIGTKKKNGYSPNRPISHPGDETVNPALANDVLSSLHVSD